MAEARHRMGDPAVMAQVARVSAEPTYGAYLALAGALDRVTAAQCGMPPLRIALLANFTVDALLPVLKGEVARGGFYPELYVSPHDAVMPTVLDPAGRLYSFKPDLVLILQWLEQLAPDLVNRFVSLSPERVREEAERVVSQTADAVAALRQHLTAPVLVNNFPLPAVPALGTLDAQLEHGQTPTLLQLNLELARRMRACGDTHVVDLLTVAARIGGQHAVDDRYWQIGRAPLARPLLLALGAEYGKLVRALRGKTRKCLVLDCDNVLWGGVVGEEGPSGIQLGAMRPGSSYRALQSEILNLHDRGILLALCSKNNEADVVEVLRDHPEMLLRESHLATWQINWDDKATNLARIAATLNIGLDSLVLMDDSAFECDFVRQQVPEVAVIHLTGDPSSFRAQLRQAGHFETLALSAEDAARNQMYRADKLRDEIARTAASPEEYLAGLEMVAEIGAAAEVDLPRVAQLTQKTNQFNLTTRRYSEAEIRMLAARADADVVTMRLADRVSSLGIIGVGIVTYRDRRADIEALLLSCRALGRGAEQALLAHLVQRAKSRGCSTLVGHYAPTSRNGQVADFYPRHGFRGTGRHDGGDEWTLELADGAPAGPAWIRVTLTSGEGKVHAGE